MALYAAPIVMDEAANSGGQAVVFLGPSCPPDQIRALLPHAMIAPPVRRGDLYRYRLLNFSIFVILDGAFSGTLAVSPREVIDILQDGAAVIGASSMGALRAVDCRPAGAIGQGKIYRLFRRRVCFSEDEVAVTYFPDPPYFATTVPLVNIRFALRRALRSGKLSKNCADKLMRVAETLSYDRRVWSQIAAAADVILSTEQLEALTSCDVKREDAIACCRWAARRLNAGKIAAGERTDRSRPLGRLFMERERGRDPLDGADPDQMLPEFAEWLWTFVQGSQLIDMKCLATGLETGDMSELTQTLNLLAPSPDLEALMMRFAAFRGAVALASKRGVLGGEPDCAGAREAIVKAHGADSWECLVGYYGTRARLAGILERNLQKRACCLAIKRLVLFPGSNGGEAPPEWKRSTN
jgi:hypothetical protein